MVFKISVLATHFVKTNPENDWKSEKGSPFSANQNGLLSLLKSWNSVTSLFESLTCHKIEWM